MKVLFDTSVLVAAMVRPHPRHDSAFAWLERARAGEIECVICAHTLAELYAVLTTLPVSPKITPGMARRLLRDNLISLARVVTLNRGDYRSVISEAAGLELRGGVIYAALIARAAKKAAVDRLLTLNPGDFKRACPAAADFVSEP